MELVSGNDYTFIIECFEDDAKTTPLDLTGVQSVTYNIWKNNSNFLTDTPLRSHSYPTGDNFIRIPVLTEGVIEVKFKAVVEELTPYTQLIHELKMVDDSGEMIILFRELFKIQKYT